MTLIGLSRLRNHDGKCCLRDRLVEDRNGQTRSGDRDGGNMAVILVATLYPVVFGGH